MHAGIAVIVCALILRFGFLRLMFWGLKLKKKL